MDLMERVKAIMLTPRSAWPVIEREPGDPSHLFSKYVALLALIPAIAGFIGTSLIGISVPAVGTLRMPFFSGLFSAVFGYLLTFVVVYVVAVIIDVLAPRFAAHRNFPNAMKLAVYSYTPVWLAGIFMLMPGLRFLTVLGLYGLYLLWTGLTPLMKAPKDKTLVYCVAIAACALVLAILLGMIQAALFSFPRTA